MHAAPLAVMDYVGPALGALLFVAAMSLVAEPNYPARPICFACTAASQKAEMMMSRSPSHFVVWPNSTSNAFPVGAIALPLGRTVSPVNVPVALVITVMAHRCPGEAARCPFTPAHHSRPGSDRSWTALL
jgi:hypothetical protein